MPSLTNIIKQASRGADLYFVFRFLRILTMKWTATDAYKYKIIDAMHVIGESSDPGYVSSIGLLSSSFFKVLLSAK